MSLETLTPPYAPTTSPNTPEVKILSAEFGDGYTQEAGDGINNIRDVVRLKWNVLTPIQAQEIENFMRRHKGYIPFYYRLSDSPSVQKWTCKEWDRDRGSPNTFSCTLRQSFTLV
jgi:phage-related protein